MRFILGLALVALVACSHGSSNSDVGSNMEKGPQPPAQPLPNDPQNPPASPIVGGVPQVGHVFIVVEENHGVDSVMNGGMPYLISLANQYGQAAEYYGNTHPSIGNYLMMTSGQIFTNNDGYNKTISIDNIARQLLAAGKTWKSYAEGLPSVGYVGGNTGSYVRRHNPLSFFAEVVNDNNQRQNLVPVTQFATDLANGTLPNYSFIVPDVDDDAHDGSLSQADDWLKANIAPLISSSLFQNDGLLIIVFDEGGIFDGAHGGGHIPFVLVSSKAKRGFKSSTTYQHENLLKLTCQALSLSSCPGAGAAANDMSEFF